jgi:hypothetical protein
MSADGATPTPALSTRPATPALALTVERAAASLSVGWDTFHNEIEPELQIVRIGRRKLVPVSELQAWLERRAERVLDENSSGGNR